MRLRTSLLSFGALVLWAGACIEVRTTACGEKICPVGMVCSASHEQCVSPTQVSACEGLADGDECVFPGAETARCTDGVCFAIGCGNGLVDPGEMCDDGDTIDGNGCSADCRSNEQCGNGIVDSTVGERCDDGNTEGGDGCQANCALPSCGDGAVDLGEACDDGNNEGGDGCNPQCTSDETCGNGVIDIAEACDDGNTVGGDGCQANCALPTCGDGALDLGEACDDGNNEGGDGCNPQCTSDETCGNGVIDIATEECDDGNTAIGDNCGATCQLEICGNMIIDPGEVCDDGNIASGDGCDTSCRSDETCGNGILDPGTGEQCDDANKRSHDGCSSGCTVELPIWRDVTPAGFPARRFHAKAYDSHRKRIVMFGGVTGVNPQADAEGTYEHDGYGWRRIETTTTPPLRNGASLAYDAKRRVVVLFGGQDLSSNQYNDTWEYDGTDWILRTPANAPPAGGGVMAYDAARQNMVLIPFGSTTTWTYDGTDWSIAATGGPSVSSMAYHAVRGTVFLLQNPNTWEWNGTSWSMLETTPGVSGHIVYDPFLARMVALGNRTWIWDGGWSEVVDATSPVGRIGVGVAYNAARRVLVATGGSESGSDQDDTWTLKFFDWEQVPSASMPSERFEFGSVYDGRRFLSLVYGGTEAGTAIPVTDTWSRSNIDWVRRDTLIWPSLHSAPPQLVYDAARRVTVLVKNNFPGDVEVWETDGGPWTLRTTTNSPPQVDRYAIAYDAARGVTVLFGTFHNDANVRFTWEYDGTDWAEVITATVPDTQETSGGRSMTYDPVRDRVVMFIGGTAGAETWEFDGSAATPEWTKIPTTTTPPARNFARIVFHEAYGTVVMFGGESTSRTALEDTWIYDGVDWTPVVTPLSPPARKTAALVYDAGRGVTVLPGAEPHLDTWELSWSSSHPDEQCEVPGDEDGDGVADCDDPDCDNRLCDAAGLRCNAGSCECPGGATETSCENRYDDDCDGDIDCADTDCAATPLCQTETFCNDGTDDDADGYTDCADPGCIGFGWCEAIETSCGDGHDNDGDGRADCSDLDCYLNPCPGLF